MDDTIIPSEEIEEVEDVETEETPDAISETSISEIETESPNIDNDDLFLVSRKNEVSGSYDTAKISGKTIKSSIKESIGDVTGGVEGVHGLMTPSDKNKLDGIDENANNYTHPEYTSKTENLYKITVDDTGHISGAKPVVTADITALGIPAITNAEVIEDCKTALDDKGISTLTKTDLSDSLYLSDDILWDTDKYVYYRISKEESEAKEGETVEFSLDYYEELRNESLKIISIGGYEDTTTDFKVTFEVDIPELDDPETVIPTSICIFRRECTGTKVVDEETVNCNIITKDLPSKWLKGVTSVTCGPFSAGYYAPYIVVAKKKPEA